METCFKSYKRKQIIVYRLPNCIIRPPKRFFLYDPLKIYAFPKDKAKARDKEANQFCFLFFVLFCFVFLF